MFYKFYQMTQNLTNQHIIIILNIHQKIYKLKLILNLCILSTKTNREAGELSFLEMMYQILCQSVSYKYVLMFYNKKMIHLTT